MREVWLCLAAARRRCGDPAGAADALGRALSGHVLDPGFTTVADDIARDAGAPGWRGLSADGAPVRSGEGEGLIGEPVRLDAIRRTQGFVEAGAGGLRGWAWHPGDPGRDPAVVVTDAAGRRIELTATDQAIPAPRGMLLARPRAIRVPEAALSGLRMPLRVTGAEGRDLLGSPLDPSAERQAARAAVLGKASPSAVVSVLPRPARPAARVARRKVAVVIPVHGGGVVVRACLASVLAARGRDDRIVVVDDASPDPALSAHLRALASARRIALIVNPRNLGFPASANAGIRAAGERDAVLLNSDALVPPDWLARLRDAAYSEADVGTASPLSNDATILSYPAANAPCPDAAGVRRMADLAWRANGAAVADVPTTVGFCMYLRRDCLEETGPLREDVFAQGYGEENDFCLRARVLGWRHVAALGAYVGHASGASFGTARTHLLARNMAILNRLHPGYDALISDFAAADPLADARRRIDRLRWPRPRRQSVILITHDEAGGVERQAAAHARRVEAEGRRAIVLRPARTPGGEACVEVCDGARRDYPNLRFAVPGETDALVRLLRAARPTLVAVHHLLGHDWSLADLPARLGVPYEVHVHDYALLCPRITLTDRDRRFCGVPDAHACDACVADGGRVIAEPVRVADYRARSAALLDGAARAVAPSADAASRIGAAFSAAVEVEPHEDDAALPPAAPRRAARGERVRVVAVGAIGPEKGLDVLLAAARDAARRGLPLDFKLVGHSTDDRRLLDAGVFVTGPFRPEEADGLIRAQRAHVALLPSIWPETWCFALTDCWRAGLDAVAFDLGAPAERIRATGRGALLPLGASPAEVNAALLAFARG